MLVTVGSLAYDSLETPAGKVPFCLGGSANYFSLSASLLYGSAGVVGVVGVVGEDYRQEDMQLLADRRVDVSGIEKLKGKTFHWQGRYSENFSEAQTLKTELNVFASFKPKLPPAYCGAPFVFLANIHPQLQLDVLEQVKSPFWVAADTMNLWIQTERQTFENLLSKINILFINEGELNLLTKHYNTIKSLCLLRKAYPHLQLIVVKRGEYGCIVDFKGKWHIRPAFPVQELVDPTGAGDSFAGAFLGNLAKEKTLDEKRVQESCQYGTVVSSFTVQGFGLKSLVSLTETQVQSRVQEYQKLL